MRHLINTYIQADDALDVAERQARIARLEEAVEPHAVLVAADLFCLNACHSSRRPIRYGLPSLPFAAS